MKSDGTPRLKVIDTHTGGEPTRVVVDGLPDALTRPLEESSLEASSLEKSAGGKSAMGDIPAAGTLDRRRQQIQRDFDWIRRGLIWEPRGYEAMVGAIVLQTELDDVDFEVVFFNNDGYLGMCGHGLIGVFEALRFSRDLKSGHYRVQTPVGVVEVDFDDPLRQTTFQNVESYRYRTNVSVDLPAGVTPPSSEAALPSSPVCGDIAYGGNWFFLVPVTGLERNALDAWVRYARDIRMALDREAIRGADNAVIDHVELYENLPAGEWMNQYEPPPRGGARTLVLCPGGHYDRSPCGTGTSAKLGCLAAAGKLEPDELWIQESILGSRFEARYRRGDSDAGAVIPSVTGRAAVMAITECVFDERDPLRFGFRSSHFPSSNLHSGDFHSGDFPAATSAGDANSYEVQ
ncbi:MAG: proline racemase family protein [Planctomycetota bacterium]